MDLANKLSDVLKSLRRPNTLLAYSGAYKRFESWTREFQELPSYPTNEYSVALYIMHLLHQGQSMATINQFIAATAWIHKLGGHATPTDHNIVKTILESSKRYLCMPTVHKIPITKDSLVQLHDSMFASTGERTFTNLRDYIRVLADQFPCLSQSERSFQNHKRTCYIWFYTIL